ncbi:MAG: hypothetical protein R3228_08295 [Halioglobus sp.]|nr:hypothetical protein [Halioglobus sp.]
MTPIYRCLLLAVALLSLTACVSQTVKSTRIPPLNGPSVEVPEELLLDVGVAIFDAGLDDYEEDDDELPIYPEVRRAEALFLPNKLAAALQDSGAWGAVRVMPNEEQLVDVLVSGTILHSDGESLKLQVTATDSRQKVWLEKTYTGKVSRYAYTATRADHDPFQAVFNTIANDLLEILEDRSDKTRRDIRMLTELRFARAFSPDAFSGYAQPDPRGRYEILRLPAEGDPMLLRVRKIRERDHVFIDTLQDYYTEFDEMMAAPYHEWRKLSYEEVIAIRELKAESMRQLVTGAVAVIGGIAAQIEGDSGASRAAGRIAMIGGAYILKSGLHKRNETALHVEALEELGTSLEAEIAPRVIDLEDRTVTLSGTVEEQYAQWRELLAEIYQTEIGDLELPAVTPDSPATL